MTREIDIQRSIMLAVSAMDGVAIWRNNVGFDKYNGVKYGLARGSADLIGLVTRADGVGVFVALEVKSAIGKPSLEQRQFGALVSKLGGVYAIVRSVEDAVSIINEVRVVG